jgi:hypothetical protein
LIRANIIQVIIAVLKVTNLYAFTGCTGCTSHSDFTDVNTYVNKEEGHEILQLGEANENGFFKYFTSRLPASLTHGKSLSTNVW